MRFERSLLSGGQRRSGPSLAPALELRGIVVDYAQGQQVRIAHFRVAAGEQVLIHGPSGRGKTTLLHLLAGLLIPNQGEVWVGDTAINQLSEAWRSRLRRQQFGMIFQTLNLIEHLTPLENIILGLSSQKAAHDRAMAALAQVGMEAFADRATVALSPGERQRVAVARVLAAKPPVILADEPTSSLDETNADVVMDALQEAAVHSTLVMVSHDLRVRSRFARVVVSSEVVAQ